MSLHPVSVVVPVLNGRRSLPAALDAIARDCAGRPFEIIAVDDGSDDGSGEYLRALAAEGWLRLLTGPGRGIAAALNTGIREARYPFIAQIDQDVIVQPGWLEALLSALADPDVAAAQGHYVAAENAGLWARVMGRDLEARYRRIDGTHVDQVCTGNTVYRASALHRIGLFDESLGYGSDNDLSYRLVETGHRLVFRRNAQSVHLWREGSRAYLRQQFGVGYGRLDLVAKHPRRVTGDTVSGPGMMLHAALMLVACLLLVASIVASRVGGPAAAVAASGGLVILLLAVERFSSGVAAWRRTGDAATLAFPAVHLLRDVAWAWAIVLWTIRRVARAARSPQHSMPRRRSGAIPHGMTIRRRQHPRRRPPLPGRRNRMAVREWLAARRVLVLIPAHNEGPNLHRVVADIRRVVPEIDILVVDDGSSDGTGELLPRLGVDWLSMANQVGVGGAVRTGLRFAVRRGYDHVIRLDGDGQHRAHDMLRLLEPVAAGEAHAVVGSRYIGGRLSARGFSKSALCLALTFVTARRITDGTSGCWVFGPEAVRLLARSHPGGYSEPELLLLLHRQGLRVREVPVRARPRHSGRTTLTWSRLAAAFARTALAMVMVPMRRVEQEGAAGE